MLMEGKNEMDRLSKQDWLLLLLRQRPLDRVRLMKALFLIWHRSGRKLEGFYEFTPYMYGPCSFDLYGELEHLEQDHLVSQAPHGVAQWTPYYLTQAGDNEACAVERKATEQTVQFVRSIAGEVGSLDFHALLRKVYSEAPDFASRTVLPWGPNQ
jgi:hypothetical protein